MPSLFNPDYLLHLCQKFGLRPSKKYGQNYLINPEVIERMVAAAELDKKDTVIEVGPGFGALTLALVEQVGRVVAYEIEKKLQDYWQKKIQDEKINNLDLVWGNILKEFTAIDRLRSFATLRMTAGYKVVANLPYQITSPVLRLFLEYDTPPTTMVLMVQKEVAERICAVPGDMSLLAISVQYYAEPEYLFTVPRTDFWPSPAVDSAVVRVIARSEGRTTPARLTRVSESGRSQSLNFKTKPILKSGEIATFPAVTRDDAFNAFLFSLVKAGFAQRRKLLLKNIEPYVGKDKAALKAIFSELGFESTVRAQELSVEQWVALAERLEIKEA